MGSPAWRGPQFSALAFTLADEALAKPTQGVLAGSGLAVLATLVDPEARLKLLNFASEAFGSGARGLARGWTAGKRPRVSLGIVALPAAALAGLSGSLCGDPGAGVTRFDDRRLHDPIAGLRIMIARLADAGNWPLLLSAALESIAQDYSWAPGASAGPPPRADRADFKRSLHVRAAWPIRRKRRCSRWQFFPAILLAVRGLRLPHSHPHPNPEQGRGL